VKQSVSPAIDEMVNLSSSRRRRLECSLYILAALTGLIGLADSIYLTVHHLTGQDVECVASTGCGEVLGSDYAAFGKVPLAALGAIAYFGIFSLSTLGAFDREWARPVFLCLVGVMLAVTCWLLYLQAFVLHAFCDFCLLSAALTVVLSVIGSGIFFLSRRTTRGLAG
jgi:uncharacterized membrane protein